MDFELSLKEESDSAHQTSRKAFQEEGTAQEAGFGRHHTRSRTEVTGKAQVAVVTPWLA